MLKKTIICCLLVCASLAPAFSAPARTQTDKDLFFKADAASSRFRNTPQKHKYRQYWLECIRLFQEVYRQEPNGAYAAAGMFRSGELYRDLYKISRKPSDLQEAVDAFERVIKRYPDSQYRRRAAEALNRIPKESPAQTQLQTPTPVKKSASKIDSANRHASPAGPVKSGPTPVESPPPAPDKDSIDRLITDGKEMCQNPDASPAPATTGASVITDLRHWSNPSYTRVVIDADSETTYSYRMLNQDPAINVPRRLYVDLNNSRLGNDTSNMVPIHDNLLENIRAAQFAADQVRVVIDIKSFKTYKIFSLKNPFRIVIDVWGSDSAVARTADKPSTPEPIVVGGGNGNNPIPPSAIARQLALGVRTIVIDAGHGGKDCGAPGYVKGIHEKSLVLTLAHKLARKIEKELNCRIILTRSDDRFLTLEERTAIANTNNADLFISLHTNAHRNYKAFGIETYFLNLATDEDSIRVAAMENATSTKNISDLQSILLDLMQNAKINESSRLATHVQNSMISRMKRTYSSIKNKGVKQAPFYVLLGAQMPAILVETGFISNPVECKRLTSSDYQDRVCDAIMNGIKTYIKETNPSAFMQQDRGTDSQG